MCLKLAHYLLSKSKVTFHLLFPEDSCFFSLGRSSDGLTNVSFPKHAATILRVPFSAHSQCLNSKAQMFSTWDLRLSADRALIISLRECRSRYGLFGWLLISLSMNGRYSPKFQTQMFSKAKDAADLTSSLGEPKASIMTPISSFSPSKFIKRPIYSRHSNEIILTDSDDLGFLTSWRRLVTTPEASLEQAIDKAATHLATE